MTKLLLALLVGFALTASCSRAGKSSQTSQNSTGTAGEVGASLRPAVLDPAEVAELAKLDYSAEIKGATSYQNYKEHLGDSPFYGMKADYDTLRPKERLLIDGWRGSWIKEATKGSSQIATTLFGIMEFTQAYSRMPRNGAELALQSIHGWRLTYDQFKALPREAQLEKVAPAVNPITGQFFTSFSAQQWQLGAMSFTMISSQEELLALLPADNHYVPTGDFKEGWHVIVYGDSPDRILLDRPYEVIYPPNNIEELSNPPKP